ncbi:hypothetical protein roselon_00896 [Roseibacterium elongatum DSM 19469]|uniref:Uncharacterized protein n=1 Tax=Roseicyclus elongatus DSM 19469 TaxID=1294273 RepID=W8SL81_9RHOB|nr:hypothetical protein [Roseibacterium elongatum]AHM03300.1 hypothetical protein roselon_00896 [Roseibacterium elongatum DSM 19469]
MIAHAFRDTPLGAERVEIARPGVIVRFTAAFVRQFESWAVAMQSAPRPLSGAVKYRL